jgi:uncharacterized protein (TIGR02145 family)
MNACTELDEDNPLDVEESGRTVCDNDGLSLSQGFWEYDANDVRYLSLAFSAWSSCGDSVQFKYSGIVNGDTVEFQDSNLAVYDVYLGDSVNYQVSVEDRFGDTLMLSGTFVGLVEKDGLRDARDGQKYDVVSIANHIWMAENLNYYTSSGSYCYDNDEAYCSLYGRLYSWTVMSGEVPQDEEDDFFALSVFSVSEEICPEGWRLPDSEAWQELAEYIAADDEGLSALKDTSSWVDGSGSNRYGFSALAAGWKDKNSFGLDRESSAYWWVQPVEDKVVYIRGFNSTDDTLVLAQMSYESAFSVRCIMGRRYVAPEVSAVYIDGRVQVGETLVGMYTFDDADNDTEGNSIFRWLRDGEVIEGAERVIYEIQEEDMGANISFEVTPVDVSLKNNQGAAASSDAVYIPVYVVDGLTDSRDGNMYDIVQIGNQVWMAENLAYLPQVDDVRAGSENTSFADAKYYYVSGYTPIGNTENEEVGYAGITANYRSYGVLYNWNAATDGADASSANPSGIQGACPEGWHLPSDAEWSELASYIATETGLTGYSTDEWTDLGPVLKEESGWITLYVIAGLVGDNTSPRKNLFLFSALPGGARAIDGAFSGVGSEGYWWSSTEYNSLKGYFRSLTSDGYSFTRFSYDKNFGYSVRCVQDAIN